MFRSCYEIDAKYAGTLQLAVVRLLSPIKCHSFGVQGSRPTAITAMKDF